MVQESSRLSAEAGMNTFGLDLMKERLPRETYEKLSFAIRNHRPISPETADVIAQAMKEWAVSRGATHYTHWFLPLTGLTAEKHDAFLSYDDGGRAMDRFSGRQLIMSEPDASSFPHGGLRSTFEARGYAAWDPSSPAFLMRRGETATLCLPSVYVSYTGEVLDKKTPLLRSVAAVSRAAVRMLRLLGNKRVTSAAPQLGAEQEYFLVDRAQYARRPDLREVGVTLLGAGPARGQQLEDHYFRAIPDRVLDFMEDVERELVRLGVPVKTRHNEAAPGQFELAVLHRPVNIAADQNHLVMETLRRVAPRHGFEALLHEKPFARVNGSGKHNNWSLFDSEGTNLLEPGASQSSRLRFLVFLLAVVDGVRRHGALLRAIVASAGNDLRLGGNEAPPAIMSVHLGRQLSALLDDVVRSAAPAPSEGGDIDLGLAGVALIPRDTTDRNRTSPFAFTGSKFEFRAVGASAAVSLTNAVINAMVAESLDAMSDDLESRTGRGESREHAVLEVLKAVIGRTEGVRYDGDNYSAAWHEEARRRGLPVVSDTPRALDALVDEGSLALFTNYGLITRDEVLARHRIRLDFYAKTVSVELKVMRRMLAAQILPAVLKSEARLGEAIKKTTFALGDGALVARQREHLRRMAALAEELVAAIGTLEADERLLEGKEEIKDAALACADVVRPHMLAARGVADALEELVGAEDWPLPSYDDMLIM